MFSRVHSEFKSFFPEAEATSKQSSCSTSTIHPEDEVNICGYRPSISSPHMKSSTTSHGSHHGAHILTGLPPVNLRSQASCWPHWATVLYNTKRYNDATPLLLPETSFVPQSQRNSTMTFCEACLTSPAIPPLLQLLNSQSPT